MSAKLLGLLLLMIALPITPATAAGVPVSRFCHAVTDTATPDAAAATLRFRCGGAPAGYQDRSLWLETKLAGAAGAEMPLEVKIHVTRFDRLHVGFVHGDGSIAWQRVASGDFGNYWRPGAQLLFGDAAGHGAAQRIILRFDRLASHKLLRIRVQRDGQAEIESAALATLIGAALTLLLVGSLYNASLAIAVRRQFLAWQGAWAACMLVWGAIWSQQSLLIAPALAGRVSAQLCTFLATLAVVLATMSAVTSIAPNALPRWLRRTTLASGLAVGIVGIPAAFVRSSAIDGIGDLLGLLTLAVLFAVAASLCIAWRRGSPEARDLAGAWAVPMAALGWTQVHDLGSSLWGGGAQLLVLFAAAWQTLWLSIAASRRLARLRIERDRARAAEAQASELAGRDPLTGLRNRRGFIAATAPLYQFARSENAPIALLLIDIDRFKTINDVHGHEAGDLVLSCIGHRLERWESALCTVARLGGEEFALLIAGLGGLPLVQFAEHVRSEIAACDHRSAIGGQRVTVSIGIAEAQGGTDFQQLYRIADRGLYAAKRAGRNRVVRPEMEMQGAVLPISLRPAG